MSNIDFSQLVSAEDKEDLARQSRLDVVKQECKARILKHMPLEAQQNIAQAMTAYAVEMTGGAGQDAALAEAGMIKGDVALAQHARKWLAAMQSASRRLSAEDTISQVTSDEVWPAFPSDVADLVARF